MKIREVQAQKPVKPGVPFVLGGVYHCEENRCLYILSECRKGGYQLASLVLGISIDEGPFADEEGTTRYLNDTVIRWAYVPDAELVVPKDA